MKTINFAKSLLRSITNYVDDLDEIVEEYDDNLLHKSGMIIKLQNRIDKAIEYIQDYHNTALWKCDRENLINILRGEDNE